MRVSEIIFIIHNAWFHVGLLRCERNYLLIVGKVNVPISDPSLFATPSSPANMTCFEASKQLEIGLLDACKRIPTFCSLYHSIALEHYCLCPIKRNRDFLTQVDQFRGVGNIYRLSNYHTCFQVMSMRGNSAFCSGFLCVGPASTFALRCVYRSLKPSFAPIKVANMECQTA